MENFLSCFKVIASPPFPGFLSLSGLFIIHILRPLGLSLPRLLVSSAQVLSSSTVALSLPLGSVSQPLLRFVLNLKSCFLVQNKIFSFTFGFLKNVLIV